MNTSNEKHIYNIYINENFSYTPVYKYEFAKVR